MTENTDYVSRIRDYKSMFIKKSQFRQKHESDEDAEGYIDLISFSLLEEIYGIELMKLREILKATNIARVPKSPEYLMGILNLRGSLITVVDLKKRLGFANSEVTKDSRVVIVHHEERSIGFLVDKVKEIMKLDKRSIIPPPTGINATKREFIKGVGKTEEREIILPDLDKILAFAR